MSLLLVLALLLTRAPAVASQAPAAQAPAPAASTAPSLALTPIPLPSGRHGQRVEVVQGGLLSFGGFGDARAPDREQKQTWWLAPGSKAWVRRADMGRPRAFFGSVVVGGKAYAIGGSVERYDADEDRWVEVLPEGTLPSSHFMAAALGQEVFVLGGLGGKEALLYVLDLATGTLRSEPPPPGFTQGDHFHLVHVLQGRLHVLGGIHGGRFELLRKHWVRAPEGWKALDDLPAPLWAKFSAHAVVAGKLNVWGEDGAWRFDPSTGQWSALPELAGALVMPATVEVAGDVWVLGGMPVEGPDARVLRRFELGTGQWSVLDAPNRKGS